MKRQIFWLLFSCSTAATFLCNSMEEDENKSYDITSSEETGQITRFLGSKNTKNKQSLLEYCCDDLKLFDRKKFRKYLATQIVLLLDASFDDEGDYEACLKEAATEFVKILNKEHISLLVATLQKDYLPELVHLSIKDLKLSLIILLILEKAIDYGTSFATEDEETNDIDIIPMLKLIQPWLHAQIHTSLETYMYQFPLSPENKKELALIEDLESIPALQKKIVLLTKQLKQAQAVQPKSNPIMFLSGMICGGGCFGFVLPLLGRAICNPCMEHFEPSTPLTAFLGTMAAGATTIGSVAYIYNSPTLPALATQCYADTFYLGALTAVQIEKLSQIYSLTKKKLSEVFQNNPWHKFDNSLTKNQLEIIEGDIFNLLFNVSKEKDRSIKNFIAFYKAYLKFAKGTTSDFEKRTEIAKFRTFQEFVKSFDRNQEKLFKNAISYLESLSLNSGKKEA